MWFSQWPEEDPFDLCRRCCKHTAHLSEDRSTEKLKRKNCQSTGRSSIEFDHCFINCIFSVRVGCLEKQLLKSSNYRAYFRNLVMRHNVLIVGKVEVGGELHKSFPWNARGNWKVMQLLIRGPVVPDFRELIDTHQNGKADKGFYYPVDISTTVFSYTLPCDITRYCTARVLSHGC